MPGSVGMDDESDPEERARLTAEYTAKVRGLRVQLGSLAGRRAADRRRSVKQTGTAWREVGAQLFRTVGMEVAGLVLDGDADPENWPTWVPVVRLHQTRIAQRKAKGEFKVMGGARVRHKKRGTGTIIELMEDGRTRVAFDNGEEHR